VWCLDLKQAIHTFGFQKHIKKQVLALAESRLHPHQFAACAKAKCPKSRFKASENKTKQNKTKQNKTKQNKTKQNKTKQNKTKQNKTKQNKLFLRQMQKQTITKSITPTCRV
jgi:hypothetical protein